MPACCCSFGSPMAFQRSCERSTIASLPQMLFGILYTLSKEKYDESGRWALLRVCLDFLQVFLLIFHPQYGMRRGTGACGHALFTLAQCYLTSASGRPAALQSSAAQSTLHIHAHTLGMCRFTHAHTSMTYAIVRGPKPAARLSTAHPVDGRWKLANARNDDTCTGNTTSAHVQPLWWYPPCQLLPHAATQAGT